MIGTRIAPATVARVVEMTHAGMHSRAIAAELGLGKSTVTKLRRMQGLGKAASGIPERERLEARYPLLAAAVLAADTHAERARLAQCPAWVVARYRQLISKPSAQSQEVRIPEPSLDPVAGSARLLAALLATYGEGRVAA